MNHVTSTPGNRNLHPGRFARKYNMFFSNAIIPVHLLCRMDKRIPKDENKAIVFLLVCFLNGTYCRTSCFFSNIKQRGKKTLRRSRPLTSHLKTETRHSGSQSQNQLKLGQHCTDGLYGHSSRKYSVCTFEKKAY